MTIEVIHERYKCIGCGACEAVCPKYWIMNGDNKSDLIGSIRIENKKEVTDSLLLEEEQGNKDAELSCPVNCIHVKKRS